MTTAEYISIIIGIICAIVAVIALKKDHYTRPIEEVQNLKLQFTMTRALSQEVQKLIENYICQYNASNKLMYDGITFGQYLNLMKTKFNESFNDEMFRFLDSKELSKPTIESMTKSLEQQFSSLQQVQCQMKTLYI